MKPELQQKLKEIKDSFITAGTFKRDPTVCSLQTMGHLGMFGSEPEVIKAVFKNTINNHRAEYPKNILPAPEHVIIYVTWEPNLKKTLTEIGFVPLFSYLGNTHPNNNDQKETLECTFFAWFRNPRVDKVKILDASPFAGPKDIPTGIKFNPEEAIGRQE